MKVSIPEISWHNREPVLSIDIQPQIHNNCFYRVATGGSDNLILIWKVCIIDEEKVDISALSELARHQRSVNVVKWCSTGEMLASGDDDGNIIVWKLKTENIPSLDEQDNEFEERWNAHKLLRGHLQDVYALSWSPNNLKLLSGSMDNTAIVWDVTSGKSEHLISDHKGFVQGVAWDPKNEYLVTLSSDRLCRVFGDNGKRLVSRIGRGTLPVHESHELYEKDVKYFHDDSFKTFFRRLCFSPDGNLLLVPSGSAETNERKNILNGTFVFSLESLKCPIFILPSGKQDSIVVECCPLLFELRDKGPAPLIELPYRMIIAVATDQDLFLYDTQQNSPFAHLQNIHYTRLTDLTWSSDGLLLAVSSTDGYVTLVTFKHEELGVRYLEPELEVDEGNITNCAADTSTQEVMDTSLIDRTSPLNITDVEKVRKPSFLEQWAKNNQNDKNCSENVVKKKRITPLLISKEVSVKEIQQEKAENIVKCVTLKRIKPTRIGGVSERFKLSKNEQKCVIDKLTVLNHVESKPEPSNDEQQLEKTPTTSQKTPNSKKTTPTSSAKRKKANAGCNNTLLNFFKPLNRPTMANKSDRNAMDDGISVSNRKKLFHDVSIEIDDEINEEKPFKIRTSALFGTKKKAEKIVQEFMRKEEKDKVYLLEDSQMSEDLVLQVEDSPREMAAAKENADEVSKTNSGEQVCQIEMKPPRRVPLTTLSSPKNKRKKVE